MDYKRLDTDSNPASEYLRKLRELEKEIYELEIEKSNAEHTVRSIEKSKSELEKQLSNIGIPQEIKNQISAKFKSNIFSVVEVENYVEKIDEKMGEFYKNMERNNVIN